MRDSRSAIQLLCVFRAFRSTQLWKLNSITEVGILQQNLWLAKSKLKVQLDSVEIWNRWPTDSLSPYKTGRYATHCGWQTKERRKKSQAEHVLEAQNVRLVHARICSYARLHASRNFRFLIWRQKTPRGICRNSPAGMCQHASEEVVCPSCRLMWRTSSGLNH